MSHKSVFLTANKIAELMPDNLNKIFFTNSGSEAVDSSLKIATAYFQAIGKKVNIDSLVEKGVTMVLDLEEFQLVAFPPTESF